MDNKSKQKIKSLVQKLKNRKKVSGKVNIENVSSPKKEKPKHVKQEHVDVSQPGSVSIGSHGGKFIQEASGHKRYVKEGSLSGTKKLRKSLKEEVQKIVTENFIKAFKEKIK